MILLSMIRRKNERGMKMEKYVKRVAAVPVLALAFALALPVLASAQDLVPIGETVGIEAVTDGLLEDDAALRLLTDRVAARFGRSLPHDDDFILLRRSLVNELMRV